MGITFFAGQLFFFPLGRGESYVHPASRAANLMEEIAVPDLLEYQLAGAGLPVDGMSNEQRDSALSAPDGNHVGVSGIRAHRVSRGCVQIAMLGGMPYTALREAVLAHPIIPEGLVSLFSFSAS